MYIFKESERNISLIWKIYSKPILDYNKGQRVGDYSKDGVKNATLK